MKSWIWPWFEEMSLTLNSLDTKLVEQHRNILVFNIISSHSLVLSHSSISWLEMINLDIDWKKWKLTYLTTVVHILSKQLKNVPHPCFYQVQRSKIKESLMIDVQNFMSTAKNGSMFAIYTILTSQSIQEPTKLPI